jgi:hypothetical protein
MAAIAGAAEEKSEGLSVFFESFLFASITLLNAAAAGAGPWLHAWYDPVAGLKTFGQ